MITSYGFDLQETLKDFYNITGIKIGIYDENGKEVYFYPYVLNDFCDYIRRDGKTDERCEMHGGKP